MENRGFFVSLGPSIGFFVSRKTLPFHVLGIPKIPKHRDLNQLTDHKLKIEDRVFCCFGLSSCRPSCFFNKKWIWKIIDWECANRDEHSGLQKMGYFPDPKWLLQRVATVWGLTTCQLSVLRRIPLRKRDDLPFGDASPAECGKV